MKQLLKRFRFGPRDYVSLAAGVVAGVGIYAALDGAHWSVPVIGGVFITACANMAMLQNKALKKQAGE